MGWLTHLKIANKLIVMLVSVLFLFSVLSGLLFYQTLSGVMEEDLIVRGRSVSSGIAELATDPILSGNLLALEEILYMEKKNNPFIEYIFILDKDDRVMAHTFSKGMPKGLLGVHRVDEDEVKAFSSDRGRIQDICRPIEDGSLGYVRLGVNENLLNEVLKNNFLKFAGIIFLAGLLGALFVYLLTRIFTRPLEGLMQWAREITKGNVAATPLRVYSRDEFGQLTIAMNVMATHLRRAEEDRRRLLAHLLTVQEEERQRISMELHDESGQALTALMLSLRTLANQARDEESQNYILAVREETAHTFQRLRNLAVELRPPALDEQGVEAAISNLVESYRRQHEVVIAFHCQMQELPDKTLSLALYRIIQECLTNIFKHAQARQAELDLKSASGELQLWVKDDGIGFTKERLRQARRENHLGLYGIQERVRLLGGTIHFTSEEPEWTTVIMITFWTHGQEKGDEVVENHAGR